MRRAWITSLAAVVTVGVMAGAASSAPNTNIRASLVTIPPKVQSAGRTYALRVRVTNRGGTFKPLCVDFTDDHNSWLIESRYRSFDSDAFCAGTLLSGQSKTLTFYVTAAKAGAHRMSVTVGKAKIYAALNDIIIDDPGGLTWEGNFVIV